MAFHSRICTRRPNCKVEVGVGKSVGTSCTDGWALFLGRKKDSSIWPLNVTIRCVKPADCGSKTTTVWKSRAQNSVARAAPVVLNLFFLRAFGEVVISVLSFFMV